MKKSIKLLILTFLLALPCQVMALDLNDFTFTAGDNTSNYDVTGKPNSVYNISQTLPSNILNSVYSMIPEAGKVNEAYLANDKATSIAIDEDLNGATHAEVSVTFLNEGAAYRNTLGYFIFETNNPPQTIDEVVEHKIIFPNTSKVDSGGTMVLGDTLDLNINVLAGHTISFFVIPNGWGWLGSYNNIESFGPWNTPFYSLSELNPEAKKGKRRHSKKDNSQHNVAFIDTTNELLVLAFEDLLRPRGDDDFNDLIFSVGVEPFKAIAGVNEDGTSDGTYIDLVTIPDPEVLITETFPGEDIYGTLAFEDNWPEKGDYDFNDVVMKYQYVEVLNSEREVKSINAQFDLVSMGASYNNGFALRLPNHNSDNVESVTLTKNGVDVTFQIMESDSNETIFVVSKNTRDDVDSTGQLTESCVNYRVVLSCLETQTENVEYDLNIEFKSPVSRSVIGQPPYDPFIFATIGRYHGEFAYSNVGKKWQTHLKQFSGTNLFDNSLFNKADDASDGVSSFVTAGGFPWVLSLTDPWIHPLISEDISGAYKKFPTWVSSGGQLNADWHTLENATTSKIAQ